MTEVAFHFNVDQTLPYVCRLLRKAVNTGARVLVTGEAETLRALDHDLWTFAPLEFVAHCALAAPADMLAASPVVLASKVDSPQAVALQASGVNILLNLKADIPAGFERFARLIEVVNMDETVRQAARVRWKTYAAAGLNMTRHDIATAR